MLDMLNQLTELAGQTKSELASFKRKHQVHSIACRPSWHVRNSCKTGWWNIHLPWEQEKHSGLLNTPEAESRKHPWQPRSGIYDYIARWQSQRFSNRKGCDLMHVLCKEKKSVKSENKSRATLYLSWTQIISAKNRNCIFSLMIARRLCNSLFFSLNISFINQIFRINVFFGKRYMRKTNIAN